MITQEYLIPLKPMITSKPRSLVEGSEYTLEKYQEPRMPSFLAPELPLDSVVYSLWSSETAWQTYGELALAFGVTIYSMRIQHNYFIHPRQDAAFLRYDISYLKLVWLLHLKLHGALQRLTINDDTTQIRQSSISSITANAASTAESSGSMIFWRQDFRIGGWHWNNKTWIVNSYCRCQGSADLKWFC